METCAGSDGNFGLVRWFGIARADIGGWSYWEAPHDVYIFGRNLTGGAGAAEIDSFHDGALRHILQTNDVPEPIRQACGVPEREHF
jgi:hypothetical protein